MARDPPRRQDHVASGSSHARFSWQGRFTLLAETGRKVTFSTNAALAAFKAIGTVGPRICGHLSPLKGQLRRPTRKLDRIEGLPVRFCVWAVFRFFVCWGANFARFSRKNMPEDYRCDHGIRCFRGPGTTRGFSVAGTAANVLPCEGRGVKLVGLLVDS